MKAAASLLFLLLDAAHGQGCYPTPEAAAHAVVATLPASGASGYRVTDLQVDAVMKRAWLRVMRCDAPSAPAVLVPVMVPLASAAGVPFIATDSKSSPGGISAAHAHVVKAGDTVRAIFASSALHMTLEAVATEPGAAGDVIALILKRRPGQALDEPEHRIRGIVRADNTVEVQP